ncbi:uncharacterized protein LOC114185490 [Vigna unguiculata]|uniref:uncharacterized protein LOC114185490 n=1 Tax=Vigna unguiculata TaxID=3917 RepID=UPI0010162F20|nr:uncharacterized protein LOC114185490 [Vigna unguiculata]
MMFETFLTLFANIWLGLDFINSITFIFLVGVFLSLWLGASVLGLREWFIKRMPLVHLIGLERNSDVVHMVSNAPLFINANDRRRWTPDVVVFDSHQRMELLVI